MEPSTRRGVGIAGEAAAAAWLEAQGYQVIARNARTRFGEIDLIVRLGETVAFVEVKSRTSGHYGHPSEAIDWRKQRRLGKLAEAYLQSNRLQHLAVRFDAVAVRIDREGRVDSIEHIIDAFEPVG